MKWFFIQLPLLFHDACTADALAASFSTGYLAKTRETFKFSDLQYLEADLQANKRQKRDHNNIYECQRLLLDAATGSTLFHLNWKDDDATTTSFSRQLQLQQHEQEGDNSNEFRRISSLARCEWIAEVLCHEKTAEGLIAALSNQGGIKIPDCDGWKMDYLRMGPVQKGQTRTVDLHYNQKTLLCCIAPHIRSPPPVLNPKDASAHLMVVETTTHGLFLGRIRCRAPKHTWHYQSSWASRPFQYSSAIHPTVAEIVVDLILDLVSDDENESRSLSLLDPTCGSGTFLAMALSRDQTLSVEGNDINPQCVEGSNMNLQYLFADNWMFMKKRCNILLKDSSVIGRNEDSSDVDCAIANLPWGTNTVDYVNQNQGILESTRRRLKPDAVCVFVHKNDKLSNPEMLQTMGFELLGEAFVPPLGFHLPESSKKGENQVDDEESSNSSAISSKHQRITVVRATRR